MTATIDVPRRTEPALGARERRRLEQQRRARRRYGRAAVAVAAVFALVAGIGGLLALVGGSDEPAAPPAPAPAEAGDGPVAGAGTADGELPPPVDAARADEADPPAAEPARADEADPPAAEPAEDRVRLQLLNGIGAPGVADEVERRLPEDEFRVVVADNAPEFGVRKTRLLVYDDDPASLAAAERLRELLGAGTISVSRQPQSVVDVTVIIGRDIDGS